MDSASGTGSSERAPDEAARRGRGIDATTLFARRGAHAGETIGGALRIRGTIVFRECCGGRANGIRARARPSLGGREEGASGGSDGVGGGANACRSNEQGTGNRQVERGTARSGLFPFPIPVSCCLFPVLNPSLLIPTALELEAVGRRNAGEGMAFSFRPERAKNEHVVASQGAVKGRVTSGGWPALSRGPRSDRTGGGRRGGSRGGRRAPRTGTRSRRWRRGGRTTGGPGCRRS